jgi:DNA polymerase III alpha subunit
LWDAHLLLGKKVIPKINANLFESEVKEFNLPELWSHRLETAFDEMELLGFMVSISPFDIQKNNLGSKMCIRDFANFLNQEIQITGYLVHVKRTQTKSGERMYFGTFIDQEGEWMDTVHFPLIAERYPFRGPGCYRMKGIVTKEFDYLNLNVHWMQRLETLSLDD